MAVIEFIEWHLESVILPYDPYSVMSIYHAEANDGTLSIEAGTNIDRQQLALLTCDRSGRWLVVCPIDQRVLVNGKRVITLKLLKHRDVITVENNDMRILLEYPEMLTADSPEVRSGVTGGWTGTSVNAGDEVIRCPNCGRVHLLRGWSHYKKCARCGYTSTDNLAQFASTPNEDETTKLETVDG